jgi:hypothetical protein
MKYSPGYNPYYIDEDDNAVTVRGGSVIDPQLGPCIPSHGSFRHGLHPYPAGRPAMELAQELCDKLNAAYHRDQNNHVWGQA